MADTRKQPVDFNLKNQICDILKDLRDKLTGDVLAFRLLAAGSDGAGVVGTTGFRMERLYCDKSFELWEKKLSEDSNSWIACHHLAIMHHAKAFDLENEGKQQDAHHHWVKAQLYWKKLTELKSGFAAIQAMLTSLRHYKHEKHADLLDDVSSRLGEDILKLHERLAKVYIDGQQPQNARYHLLAIKRSPFECAGEFYREAYENNFGRIVHRQILALKSRIAPAYRVAQRTVLEALSEKIMQHYADRNDAFPLARDLLRIDVWLFKINYIQFGETLAEINLQLKEKSDHLERLKSDILAFNAKYETVQAGEAEFISIREKAERHDRILREYNVLIGKIRQKYKDFIPRAEKIETHLRELSNLTERVSLDDTEVELRELILECRLQGAEDWEEYKALEKIYNRLQQFLNRNAAGAPDDDKKIKPNRDRESFELWPSSICANKQNPYAVTCFLLFGVEPPKLMREINLEAVVDRFKQRKRGQANRAQRNRLFVLDRKISKTDLNVALDQVKEPEGMLRNILFQHQAHPCDTKSEREKLEQLPLPAAHDLTLKPTPAIYDYLPEPHIEIEERLKLDPGGKRLIEIPEPDIEWPA